MSEALFVPALPPPSSPPHPEAKARPTATAADARTRTALLSGFISSAPSLDPRSRLGQPLSSGGAAGRLPSPSQRPRQQAAERPSVCRARPADDRLLGAPGPDPAPEVVGRGGRDQHEAEGDLLETGVDTLDINAPVHYP